MMIMRTSAHINTVGTAALSIISSNYIEVEVIKVNQIRKNQIPAVQNPTQTGMHKTIKPCK